MITDDRLAASSLLSRAPTCTDGQAHRLPLGTYTMSIFAQLWLLAVAVVVIGGWSALLIAVGYNYVFPLRPARQ